MSSAAQKIVRRSALVAVREPEPLPEVSRGRPRLAWFISLLLLALAPIGFVLVDMPDQWADSSLFLGLTGLTVAAAYSALTTRSVNHVDCGDANILLGLAVLGPLPAMAITSTVEFFQWCSERYRAIALVANLASFAWSILAAAATLQMFGIERIDATSGFGGYVVLAVAGVVMICTQYLLGVGLLVGVHAGGSPRSTVTADFLVLAPAQLIMLALGVAATGLYLHVGLWAAISVLVTNIVAWQVLAPRLATRRLMAPSREIPPAGNASLRNCRRALPDGG